MENNFFAENGYYYVKGLYTESELSKVRPILDKFHQHWLQENQSFYQSRGINSSGLTGAECLSVEEKFTLFEFVSANTLLKQVKGIVAEPQFMNTQLFFNPYNPKQANYWHRDMQYHLELDAQKAALSGPEVLHCRVAFEDEPGIELIPSSHKNWDSDEELIVRLEQQGARNSDSLTRGKSVALKKGDLLIFSANMIHRGLYGMNRFALDILYFERHPSLNEFVQTGFLPTAEQKQHLKNPMVFK